MQLRSCLIVLLLATFGCTPEPDVGVVEVPLTATGADGAIYELIDAELDVQGGRFRERVSLDGFETSISFEVPVGMYQLKLLDNGVPATTFRLMKRESDGTISGVDATLETPMPMSITVLPDSTTAIVLTFRVPGSGVITFAKGSISVSTDADIVAASSAKASLGGTLTFGNSAQTALMPASITVPADGTAVLLH